MMGAAFVGVIGWSFLGLAGADGIFPSVPGMGAAFVAHFVMNQIRTPDVSSLGRYNWPDGKTLGAIGSVICLTFLAGEVSYLVNAPDSSDSMGGVGDYTIDSTLSVHDFADGTEYVMDGDTVTLVFNTDSIASWENGDNIVGVRVLMAFDEDETSSGFCAASNNAADTITGTIIHDEYDETSQDSNGNGQGTMIFETIWYNSTLAESGNSSGLSEAEIDEELEGYVDGFGAYNLDITVEADAGGRPGCTHSDEGEEVTYAVQLLILDYSIESA